MARRGNLTFIANATGSSGPALISLNEIPQEVKDEVEEIYKALKENVDGRMRVEFDNKAECERYMKQVISYCTQRPNGKLRFRKSPTRGLQPNVMDFRITDPVAEDAPEASTPASAPAETATPAASGGRSKR